MVSLAIRAASWLVYDVLFLCFFVFSMRLLPAVWSLVLLSITGVRADSKYSYSYNTIYMCVRIVPFGFSLKYLSFLVGTC